MQDPGLPNPGRWRRRFWHLLLALDMAALLAAWGFGIIRAASGSDTDRPAGAYVAGGMVLALMLAVIPLAWLRKTCADSWRSTFAEVGLNRLWPDTGLGVLLGFGLTGTLLVAGIVAGLGGADVRGAGVHLPWSSILLASLLAAVGEEVFFRGFLLKWTSWWFQAPVFALAHPSAEPWALAVVLGIGFLFGYIAHTRNSLAIPVAAHFAFDFLQLTATRVSA